ncbi:MAG: nuclear transport factor 2 family protein [Saprospiraceae bacterium]
MKNTLLLFLMLMLTLPTFSQETKTDDVQIKNVIDQLFDGMRETDSTKIRAVVYPNATLKTISTNKKGKSKINTGSMEQFIASVGSEHDGVYDEKIWSYDIKVDGNMATAWTEYTFYVDKKLLHCGVNAFELFKSDEGWKIIGITDTRRKNNCKAEPIYAIDEMMNNWHRAATVADEDVFFGSMTEDCIYIGTDKTERWLRDELKAWSAKYFKRDQAWDFKTIERQIHVSDDDNLAWFNETLDTWMGVCRSSGVVALVNGEWKLKHYHLSITVPNDVVKDFLELVEKYETEDKD